MNYNKILKCESEVLIAFLLFGIIFVLGLANFQMVFSRAKSAEANIKLERIYKLEKEFLMKNGRYSYDLNEIRFSAERLIYEGGGEHYKIAIISANNKTFVAKATSITDFDGDGEFNVWEMNQDKNLKELIPD